MASKQNLAEGCGEGVTSGGMLVRSGVYHICFFAVAQALFVLLESAV